MLKITLPKNNTELDYFRFGEYHKMKIIVLPSTIFPIKIQMKKLQSGKSMTSPMEITKSITEISVYEYDWMRIIYCKSDKDQIIQLYFDNEIN